MDCFYFLSETFRPGCNADHHFGTVSLMFTKDHFVHSKKQMSKQLMSQDWAGLDRGAIRT